MMRMLTEWLILQRQSNLCNHLTNTVHYQQHFISQTTTCSADG